jgi:signal transduction histidine kinase
VKYLFKPRSLKWRLVSRFSIALALMMVVFYAALIWLIVAATSDATPVDDTIKAEIAASIHLDGGTLRISPTGAIQTIIRDYPDFWLVARDDKGREARIGRSPAGLDSVLASLDIISALDVRVGHDSPMTAIFALLETDAGPVKAIYGGKSAPGSVLEYMVRTLHVIYLPTTLIPLILAVVIIPLVVNSSLKGMKRITALASQIDVNKPGVRLPTDDVVEEIAPLVKTINAALARVDTDVSARERFLADAAHELRTPIAILQTRIEGYEDTEQNRRLLLDVSRIGAVAEQLLDIQRFAVMPTRADTDLVGLCQQVVADLAPLAINAGYDLAFESDCSSMIVVADRLSVERAITNLVRNAIQHAGNHGQIMVRLCPDGAIEVLDEGEGIPDEEREKIFDPFYRSKPQSTGAGLGLNLVRQIARLHGGDAVVLPTKGGALFRLTLEPERLPGGVKRAAL